MLRLLSLLHFRRAYMACLCLLCLSTAGHAQWMNIQFSGSNSLEQFCQTKIINTATEPVQSLLFAQLTYGEHIVASASTPFLVQPGLTLINRHDLFNRQIVGGTNHQWFEQLSTKWEMLEEEVNLCVRIEPVTDIGLPESACHSYQASLERPHLLYPFHDDTIQYTSAGLGFIWTPARCGDQPVTYSLSIWEAAADTASEEQPHPIVCKVDSLLVTAHAIADIRQYFLPNRSYTWTVMAHCGAQELPAYEQWVFHLTEDTEDHYYAQVKPMLDGGAVTVTDGTLSWVYPERYGTQPLSAAIMDVSTQTIVQELEGIIPHQGKNYFTIDVSCICDHSGTYKLMINGGQQTVQQLLFSIDKALKQNQCNKP